MLKDTQPIDRENIENLNNFNFLVVLGMHFVFTQIDIMLAGEWTFQTNIIQKLFVLTKENVPLENDVNHEKISLGTIIP